MNITQLYIRGFAALIVALIAACVLAICLALGTWEHSFVNTTLVVEAVVAIIVAFGAGRYAAQQFAQC